MTRLRALSVCGLLCLVALRPLAAEDEERSERLRRALKDEHVEGIDLWVYNDIESATAEARRSGKPLFVTFRCIPCKACAGFDAEVAQGNGRIRELARERFVAVRQVEMKGVDLSLFQFDHDLNWAAMFVNADGVVYARYGTQSAAGPDAYNSIAGLEETMRRVLALHEGYPANRAELAGKRGKQKPYRTALDMPGLERRDKLRGETSRENCIHCHNIHDAENLDAQSKGAFTQDMLWRYPLPDNAGLVIDARSGVRIAKVVEGSPAERAGLRAGEDVTHVSGQAMTSIADMQWVLHHLPNVETDLVVRGSASGERTLRLPADWKRGDFSWRGSMWSVQPRLRVWAPELGPAELRERGLPDGKSALHVRWINTDEPGGRAARDAGLRDGDLIVEIDGKPFSLTTPQFNMHLKLHYKVGDVLPLTVLRGKERKAIKIPLVE